MSAIPAPSTRVGLFVATLLLIDVPVFVGVLVCGFIFGFTETYEAVMEWRLQHPWSLVPSVVVAGWIVWRWCR